MFFARLICSDDGCDVEYEAMGSLEDLEAYACEFCGCTLQVIGWAEPASNGAGPVHVQLVG